MKQICYTFHFKPYEIISPGFTRPKGYLTPEKDLLCSVTWEGFTNKARAFCCPSLCTQDKTIAGSELESSGLGEPLLALLLAVYSQHKFKVGERKEEKGKLHSYLVLKRKVCSEVLPDWINFGRTFIRVELHKILPPRIPVQSDFTKC